jgi:hypothetical protein
MQISEMERKTFTDVMNFTSRSNRRRVADYLLDSGRGSFRTKDIAMGTGLGIDQVKHTFRYLGSRTVERPHCGFTFHVDEARGRSVVSFK